MLQSTQEVHLLAHASQHAPTKAGRQPCSRRSTHQAFCQPPSLSDSLGSLVHSTRAEAAVGHFYSRIAAQPPPHAPRVLDCTRQEGVQAGKAHGAADAVGKARAGISSVCKAHNLGVQSDCSSPIQYLPGLL